MIRGVRAREGQNTSRGRGKTQGVGGFYNSGFRPVPLTIVFGLTARINPTGTELAWIPSDRSMPEYRVGTGRDGLLK